MPPIPENHLRSAPALHTTQTLLTRQFSTTVYNISRTLEQKSRGRRNWSYYLTELCSRTSSGAKVRINRTIAEEFLLISEDNLDVWPLYAGMVEHCKKGFYWKITKNQLIPTLRKDQ